MSAPAEATPATEQKSRWQRIKSAASKEWKLFKLSLQADRENVRRRYDRLPLRGKVFVRILPLLLLGWAAYNVNLEYREAKMEAELKEMSKSGGLWTLNDKLPVEIGPGSLLMFLEKNAVDMVTVVYRPISISVSERVILVEAKGRYHAFYPSDMEMQIFLDRAISAKWGQQLAFVPRSELSQTSREWFAKLDKRFSNARPLSLKSEGMDGAQWFTILLMLILVVSIVYQMRGMVKPLRFINPRDIEGDINDLVGMDDIKAEVFQLKDQYLRRSEYASYGIDKPFNVMFSGPAGTGKTKLASYLAKDLNLPILFHSAADLETGFVGGGAGTLKRITAQANRKGRCIVFLDEAQDLFMKRGGRRRFDDDTSNTMLAILDGVRSKGDAEIIWIVASNFNADSMEMDEAMLRRFQMKVDFRLPNKDERLGIIQHYLSQRADKVDMQSDLRHLIDITEGCSPADLETIVNQAGISAVKAGVLITSEILMQAAERVLVGNVNTSTTADRNRDRRIISIHEWGHFLVDFHAERIKHGGDWDKLLSEMKTIKISLKANPRSNALGFVFHKQGNDLLKTKSDLEHEVRVLLGGMANEELFFGEDGTTNGAHNDITRVTRLLFHAVGEMGMFRKSRLNFSALQNPQLGQRDLDDETRSIMEEQSERLFNETKGILEAYQGVTEYLTKLLLEKNEMTLAEAIDAIRGFEMKAAA